jgi:hypothetical protein
MLDDQSESHRGTGLDVLSLDRRAGAAGGRQSRNGFGSIGHGIFRAQSTRFLRCAVHVRNSFAVILSGELAPRSHSFPMREESTTRDKLFQRNGLYDS